MKTAPCSCENGGKNICLKRKLCDLEYADDVVLLNADPDKLKAFSRLRFVDQRSSLRSSIEVGISIWLKSRAADGRHASNSSV